MNVRAECKRRFGPGPCARIYASDLKTVLETFDCATWCAALQRRIEDDEASENTRE